MNNLSDQTACIHPNLASLIAEEFTQFGFVRVNLTNGYVIEIELYDSGNTAVVVRAPVTERSPYGGCDLIYQTKTKPASVAIDAMMARIVEWMRPKTEPADLAPF